MRIDKYIDKNNWDEIKDILPHITEIKSLNLGSMGLTEFPKMSHITIKGNFDISFNQLTSFKDCPVVNGDFYCNNNLITSFKDCPEIGGDFNCYDNQITSFKDCPQIKGYLHCTGNQIQSFKNCPNIGGYLYSDIIAFRIIHKYSKEKKISHLEAQVELYNQQNKELLEHIDKFPDLIAYIRMRELNKLLD